MIKKLLGILAVLAIALNAQATTLSRGTRELLFSGMLDVDSVHAADLDLTGGYGYFVEDNEEFGGRASIGYNDVSTVISLTPFYEWSFEKGNRLTPFTGLHGGLAYADIEGPGNIDGNVALVAGASLGARYFVLEDLALSRHMAISGEFIFEYATDKIYLEGDDPKNIDWRLEAGLRFFF